jgi:general stress protein 26
MIIVDVCYWRKRLMNRFVRFFVRALMLLPLASVLTSTAAAEDKPKARPTPDRAAVIAAARELIATQTYCALITLDAAGRPSVRTMNPFPPDDNMVVWFATNDLSRKVEELRRDPRVTLYYADHNQATGYVAITGRAVLTQDEAEIKAHWREYWSTAFPDRKRIVLIKVLPERLDVLYYQKGMLGDSVTWRTPSIDLMPSDAKK